MGVQYDHTQEALDANMILGSDTTTLELVPGPYNDEEVWRSWIDPGLNGTFEFIEATLRFRAFASGGDNSVVATWKWQIRSKGQAAWTDLHDAVSDTFTANLERVKHVVFDAVSPTAEDVPFELRFIFTTADIDDDITFVFSSIVANSTNLRVVGESS